MLEEDPDAQPMDTGAVIAGHAPAQQYEGRAPAQGINTLRRQREQTKRFYCGEIGHLIRDCKRMRELPARQEEASGKVPGLHAACGTVMGAVADS